MPLIEKNLYPPGFGVIRNQSFESGETALRIYYEDAAGRRHESPLVNLYQNGAVGRYADREALKLWWTDLKREIVDGGNATKGFMEVDAFVKQHLFGVPNPKPQSTVTLSPTVNSLSLTDVEGTGRKIEL